MRRGGRFSAVFLSCAIALAVIGYFVGLTDGVPRPNGLPTHGVLEQVEHQQPPIGTKVVPALRYAEIPQSTMGPTRSFQALGKTLPQPAYNLFAELKPSDIEKEASGQLRASRRAYNGAPPVIPHAVQDTNDAACYACHSSGMQMGQHKASVMSHVFLSNCTQCHAPPPPPPFQELDVRVETSFVGLPAPKSGSRAYPGAPPTIPHSQWMREKCSACHGGMLGTNGWSGWAGMQSTHPWRTNCTQCHAPSASLDQAITWDTSSDRTADP
jgi:nitrate reductase (cytochrome), electron transfer subunit